MENYMPIVSVIVTICFTLVNLFITVKYSSFNKLNSQKTQLLAKREDISRIFSLCDELWKLEDRCDESHQYTPSDIEQRESLILDLSRLTSQLYTKNIYFSRVDPVNTINNLQDLIIKLRKQAIEIDSDLQKNLNEIDKKVLYK
ncbi:MAG: hypothetical protein ACRCZW_11710 [Lactobacillaceae bacterium]